MPFFIKGKGASGEKGKKRPSQKIDNKGSKGKRRRLAHLDQEIESDSEIDSDEADPKPDYSSDEEDKETAKEKQLRLAKKYLANLSKSEDLDDEGISEHLQKDVLTQSGKLFKTVASQYTCPDPASIKVMRGHKLSVTCAVVSSDGKTAFSASKEGTINKWCLESNKKLCTIPGGKRGTEKTHVGHTTCVYCMAISSDGKFLATGGGNDSISVIHIWNASNCQHLHTFRGHRKPVKGLAFRKNSHNLYSVSEDRLIKSWDVDQMSLIETNHGTDMVAVAALNQECPVTVGGRERLVLLHNVVNETIRQFSAKTESDCITQINEAHFVTGGNDNSLTLWNINKKNPCVVQRNAHPQDGETWISAVASLQYTDLLASGSNDGFVRLWQTAPEFKGLTCLFSVPVTGFVNSLEFSQNGDFLLVGVGQEHRLGRWCRIKEARNGICVIPLPKQK